MRTVVLCTSVARLAVKPVPCTCITMPGQIPLLRKVGIYVYNYDVILMEVTIIINDGYDFKVNQQLSTEVHT